MRGAPIALGGAQQRSLLAVLLLRRGQAVSTDRLIDQLWGERPPPTATKTVHVYVSQLRKALGEGLLETHGRAYLLVAEPGQVDVDRFDALAGAGREALSHDDAGAASRFLSEALALWRGPPLADFEYEPFAQSEIARLVEARLAALEDRIDADLALGRHAGLVSELEALVVERPLRERLQAQLMLALYRSGRQVDALERYRHARSALVDELGLEPGRALAELERAILAGDPALEAPSRLSPVLDGAAVRRRSRRGGSLIAAGGALLLAMLAITTVELARGGGGGLARVEPNSVAAIDLRTNQVVGQVPVGARPDGISYGSGSLWVANLDDQTVSRIDPTTLQSERTLPVGQPPTGIAATQGGVWVVGSDAGAATVSVRKIDPQFDAITNSVRIGNVVPGGAGTVATQGGAVWVAPSSGVLTRLDPATARVTLQVDPNAGPSGIAIGAGAVWLTDPEADTVTRIDPTGLVTPTPVGRGPTGIAVGGGSVWVSDSFDDAIVRIDPTTRAVSATVSVGRAPSGVTVGGGSVWVANSGDGTVTRIDAATGRPVATIVVGGSPRSIAIGGGRAWVTVDTRSGPGAAATALGGTLRLDSQSDVDYMDPALAYTALSDQLLYATCARLLNYPDRGGGAGSQLIPEVAQSLPRRSADGRTYTFTIRNGFRFSPPSDARVTAQTFKDTIERTLSPRMKSPVAHEYADIVGASAYMAGKAAHLAGVLAAGNTLTIRLVAPAPDLPARIAATALCAVPSGTPIDPNGVRAIPSAGPYYVTSYTPGQGVVLTRNPNYHGSRPHTLDRIELTVGVPPQRAIASVEAGAADYTALSLGALTNAGGSGSLNLNTEAANLTARYGPSSPAAARGHQQYFVTALPQLDYFELNTHRAFFHDLRMRQAVNYAIDRRALARLGSGYQPLPDRVTDHYLPPSMPGFTDLHVYPPTPDVGRAKQLAGSGNRTANLYTCDVAPCGQQAQIVKADLAPLGIQVNVKAFSLGALFARVARPGEPFDLAYEGWLPDYFDPEAMLDPLLEDPGTAPSFENPIYQRRLAAAALLSGPRRYLAYARLNADLARNAAPLLAYGNLSSHDLFSARVGCQTYGVYGVDLAALCITRSQSHQRPN